MSQTLTRLLVHIVFSTKGRVPTIPREAESDLYAYLGGIGRNLESPLIAAGGTEDHLHLLVSQSKNISLADLVMNLKKDSSKWLKRNGAGREFDWQDGYGGFTIGESGVEALRRYFARQKEHHRKQSFKEEYLALLAKYKVKYDPRYIWD
jgi:putative transposase